MGYKEDPKLKAVPEFLYLTADDEQLLKDLGEAFRKACPTLKLGIANCSWLSERLLMGDVRLHRSNIVEIVQIPTSDHD